MIALLAVFLFGGPVFGTVYYGKLADSKKPAECTAKAVFAEIPEYKKIKEKGLSQDDPEYWILLGKANEKFYAAVKKVGERNKFDVIVEKGTAKFDPAAPDVTQKVIAALAP